MDTEEAPGELELVRRFANTIDIDAGTDAIATPADLRRWLVDGGLVAASCDVGAEDLELARRAREGLRALMAATHHPAAEDVVAGLDAVAVEARLRLRFRPDDVRLEPAADGVPGALGRLLVIAAAAMNDGTWRRLKLCAADTCAEAFYDRSRNRAGRWCSMEVCGNRAKVRSYRSRSG